MATPPPMQPAFMAPAAPLPSPSPWGGVQPARPTLIDDLKTKTGFASWSMLKMAVVAAQVTYLLALVVFLLLPFTAEGYIEKVLYADEGDYLKRENEFGRKLRDIGWRLFFFGGSAAVELLVTVNDWFIATLVVLTLRGVLTLIHLGFSIIYLPFIILALLSAIVGIVLFVFFYYELRPKQTSAAQQLKLPGMPPFKATPGIKASRSKDTSSTSPGVSLGSHTSTGTSASSQTARGWGTFGGKRTPVYSPGVRPQVSPMYTKGAYKVRSLG